MLDLLCQNVVICGSDKQESKGKSECVLCVCVCGGGVSEMNPFAEQKYLLT